MPKDLLQLAMALLAVAFVAVRLSELASRSTPSPCEAEDPRPVCDWFLSQGRY